MRTLKFSDPVKIVKTTIDERYLDYPDVGYYGRGCSVITKYGIVVVADMNWKHNHGRHNFSIFSTVLNGLVYSATLNEGGLSDRQIKWLATNFIKKVIIV